MARDLTAKMLDRFLAEQPLVEPFCDATKRQLFRGGMDVMAKRVRSWIDAEIAKATRDPLATQYNEARLRVLRQILTLLDV